MSDFQCPGCNREFTSSRGLQNHLSQTTQAQCQHILIEVDAVELDDNLDADFADFDGDFFGHHDEEELPWPHGTNNGSNVGDVYWPPAESSSDEELEDEEDSEDEDEEEPLPAGFWQQLSSSSTDNLGASASRFRTSPTSKSIVEFPSALAGQPIRRDVSQHAAYKDNVPGAQWNPWAPFVSRIDWEVARWAKLRSPSSTAFTELLDIDGVRLSHLQFHLGRFL